MEVNEEGEVRLNGEKVSQADLAIRLKNELSVRPSPLVYFYADRSLQLSQAVTAMDTIQSVDGKIVLLSQPTIYVEMPKQKN